MTDVVAYRGPDDEGFAVWGNLVGSECLPSAKTSFHLRGANQCQGSPDLGRVSVALGHRRLSILDLSPKGRQPMSSADGRLWIVFNGEIYNYVELRAELEDLGHRFVTGSDTEVILAAFTQWKDACLSRFNGMWAFAIYDTYENVLFVSRDRFGVKPLYFACDKDTFAFSSEIKQLRAAGYGDGNAQRRAVANFLQYGTVNADRETLFSQISQLLPGEKLHWRIPAGTNAIQISRYYTPFFNTEMRPNGTRSLQHYRQEFATLLEDAVRLRLRSDVAIGSCLSGGLDSSSIVAMAKRLLCAQNVRDKQKTFTSCFEDPRFDEWRFAFLVAAATGVDAYQVFPKMEQLWEEIDDLAWHQEEPFGSTSIYAQWNVMRFARDTGLKVLLDGQGADEVMAGYHCYIPAFLCSLAHVQPFDAIKKARQLWETGVLAEASAAVGRSIPSAIGKFVKRRLLSSSKWASSVSALINPEYRGYRPIAASSFQHLLYQDVFGSLQALLRYEDRNSMAFSIEARTPYLDYRVVECFLQMPGSYKMRDGWTKPFTREAMAGLLPDPVRFRSDKKGFETPQSVWCQNNLRPIKELLLTADNTLGTWVDRRALRQWLDNLSYVGSAHSAIWRMLSVHVWMKRFRLG